MTRKDWMVFPSPFKKLVSKPSKSWVGRLVDPSYVLKEGVFEPSEKRMIDPSYALITCRCKAILGSVGPDSGTPSYLVWPYFKVLQHNFLLQNLQKKKKTLLFSQENLFFLELKKKNLYSRKNINRPSAKCQQRNWLSIFI